MRVKVEHEQITFTLETGPASALPLVVQGREVALTRGDPLVVPLDPWGRLSGRPSMRDIVGTVREDGSVMQATVPSHPTTLDPETAEGLLD